MRRSVAKVRFGKLVHCQPARKTVRVCLESLESRLAPPNVDVWTTFTEADIKSNNSLTPVVIG